MAASIEGSLRASRFFGGLSESLIAEFARAAVRRVLHRGDYLWHAGESAVSLTVIAKGLVKVCRSSSDDSSAIVALFGPRESVGDVAVFSRGVYPADAIAASDALELLSVDKAPVLSAMKTDLSVSQAMQRSLVDHTQALHEKIRIMTAGPVDRRLATLLEHLAERFGDRYEDGSLEIPVALSRAELACLVGATNETTIRIMSRWQKDGLLSTTPDGFVIRKPAELRIAFTD